VKSHEFIFNATIPCLSMGMNSLDFGGVELPLILLNRVQWRPNIAEELVSKNCWSPFYFSCYCKVSYFASKRRGTSTPWDPSSSPHHSPKFFYKIGCVE